jgi:hypothetical protein
VLLYDELQHACTASGSLAAGRLGRAREVALAPVFG